MLIHEEAEVNTYDVSLEDQIAVLNEAANLQDDTPISKLSKEELIGIHLNNLRLQKADLKTSEPHPFVLPAAYAPSMSSLNELQKV
jgi:hypothetical protein